LDARTGAPHGGSGSGGGSGGDSGGEEGPTDAMEQAAARRDPGHPSPGPPPRGKAGRSSLAPPDPPEYQQRRGALGEGEAAVTAGGGSGWCGLRGLLKRLLK
jgi:hypothetical protein